METRTCSTFRCPSRVPALALVAGSAAFAFPDVTGGAAQELLAVAYLVSEEPRLQIGAVDGDGFRFSDVTDAIRLRDGRFLVADGGARNLKLFDARGSYLTSIGREGDGPGEFRHPYRLAEMADGQLAALDPVLARVTVFSPGGAFDRTYRIPQALDPTGTAINLRGLLANGSVVGLRAVDREGTEVRYGDGTGGALIHRDPIVRPILIDTLGRVTPFLRPIPGNETVSLVRTNQTAAGMDGGEQLLSIPYLRTLLVAARGDRIAIGPIEGYFAFSFDGDGTMRTSAGGSLPEEAPSGVRETWVDKWASTLPAGGERQEWRDRFEALFSSASTPPRLPAFTALAVQGEGKVWREVYDPGLDEGAPSRWIVQDPSGMGYGGTVSLAARFRPYDIGADYVLGVWRDERDVEFVRLYDLIEGPGEG